MGAAVTQYPAEDYRDMRMFTTPEQDAGFALKGNDIVSVFKHPKAPYRNVTRSMLDLAKQNGGQRLDAFDTVLPHIYAQNGFRAVARLPWNEDYKPQGWRHEDFSAHNGGRPDVTFMVHDPQAGAYQPGDGRTVADYDEGTAHQHAALAHAAARGNVPAEPGPESYGSGQLIRMADPLTVHHGTPHEFAPTRANPLGEFNLSKLGTGEGAQAYGKGIYQAGNPRVAEEYRDDLSEGVKYQGGSIPRSMSDPHALAVHQVAEYMQDQGLSAEQAIVKVRSEYEDAHALLQKFSGAKTTNSAQEAMRRRMQLHLGVSMAAQRLQPRDFTHSQGQLYESELHIHPDHMLDWDKPISEHHPYVQHRVKTLIPEPRYSRHDVGRMTGMEVHNYLSGQPAIAAQQMLGAGIPGIRYLDAGSRQHAHDLAQTEAMHAQLKSLGQTDPAKLAQWQADIDRLRSKVSHNYVVFDPRTLNVVKRNGLPAMVDAGADALREHKVGG